MKRWFSTVALSLSLALGAYAQEWTAEDSLRLKRLLENEEELKLNPKAVEAIDFGGVSVEAPHMSMNKPWLSFDTTLPQVGPKRPKLSLFLRPYSPDLIHDWETTFRFYRDKLDFGQYNTLPETVTDTVEEGVSRPRLFLRMMARRAQLMNDGRISIGKKGVYIENGTIGGLDLMAMFTKDFWNRKDERNRLRTLEVLKYYGDSTTVWINHPVFK